MAAALHPVDFGGVEHAKNRLVLVEDHALLREGLRALLELEHDLQISGYFRPKWEDPTRLCAEHVTGREREVLTQVALGSSNKLSARALGVSVKTVEKPRANLMRKLTLHNTAAVTRFAIRHGMVAATDALTPVE